MDNQITSNALRESLLARDVYCVCLLEQDSLEIFQGELATVRKQYFTSHKTVKVDKNEIIKGYDGKLRGKLSRRSFHWKKLANKVHLEEAFGQKGGFLLVTRDFHNFIQSRTYFDKEHAWIKSEYYSPAIPSTAQVILKPCPTFDGVERFDWNREAKRYQSTVLYPVIYLLGTAEQSVMNASLGEPKLLLQTDQGSFCYCSKEEAAKRRDALDNMGDGTIILLPAWEVKDGALAGEEENEPDGPDISFAALDSYAKTADLNQEPLPDLPEQVIPSPEAETPEETKVISQEKEMSTEETPLASGEKEGEAISQEESFNEEHIPTTEEVVAPVEKTEETVVSETILETATLEPDQAAILAAAEKFTQPFSQPAFQPDQLPQNPLDPENPTADESGGLQSMVVEGQITGRGRTQQPNGLTAYDGEFENGKRQGFGSYYYKDGNLCYAGFWKDDKRDGLGVSFRGEDHALHVAKWQEGKPDGMVSLFDSQGNLRYSGRMEDGMKQGVGITYDQESGRVFVGKWENGESTGIGSAFDPQGNLLYTGGWLDGKRHGQGTQFDIDGTIIFDGEWRDGKYHNGILYKKPEKQEAIQDESAYLANTTDTTDTAAL